MQPTVIVATTKRHTVYRVPKGVTLLPVALAANGSSGIPEFNAKVPWSWHLWHKVLRFWDAEGRQHEVQGSDFWTGFEEVEIEEEGNCWGEEASDEESSEESSKEFSEDKVGTLCGVTCNFCKATLPRHTKAQHLDETHAIHRCPGHALDSCPDDKSSEEAPEPSFTPEELKRK